jgi:hypothetical protein
LLLVEVDSSGFPVSSNPYTKKLKNLPQVLGVKPSMENITKPINIGLVFSGGYNVVDIDEQVELPCLMYKKTRVCQALLKTTLVRQKVTKQEIPIASCLFKTIEAS